MIRGDVEEGMTMERLVQLAYLAGYRDGLERAEQLVRLNAATVDIEREAEKGATASRSRGRHANRLSPLFRLARPRHKD
jgi:hypothetical protein